MFDFNKNTKFVMDSEVMNEEHLYQSADMGVDFSLEKFSNEDSKKEMMKRRRKNGKRSKKATLHDLNSFALVSVYNEEDLLKALEMMKKRYS